MKKNETLRYLKYLHCLSVDYQSKITDMTEE